MARTDDNKGTFPKMWEIKQPTIDKFVLQKLNKIEQEVKEVKEKLEDLKKLL